MAEQIGDLARLGRVFISMNSSLYLTGNPRQALYNAEAAERDIDNGTPDWLRAQDVAMQARAELERDKDRR